jgi:hypothetical protein
MDGPEHGYGGDMRLNLSLPDDLHADLERTARREGMQPTSYARVLIARGLGRAEAMNELDELRAKLAEERERVEARLAALESQHRR